MGRQENPAIVIDDYFVEAANHNQVLALFSRGRHLNISIILLSQNLFHRGKYARDMSLNMDYIVIFKLFEMQHKFDILDNKCIRKIKIS